MASLAQLEELFWRAVRSRCTPSELEAELVGSAALGAGRRMGIYRSAYWLRQQRVLADTFPAVRASVGDARFRWLTVDYLMVHPSDQPAIERVGQRFADALARRADLPVHVADLARLEWARLDALLAPAAPVVRVDDLRGVDFAAARGRLCPSVRTLQLLPSALQAWREHALPGAQAGAAAGACPDTRIGCLVWRRGHQVHQRALDPQEWAALELLASGHDFARVCAEFGGRAAAAHAAAQCIGRWFRDGLVSALGAAPDPVAHTGAGPQAGTGLPCRGEG